ncbi:MAG: 2-hydroxyacyl-CoA dehydratase family protein [Candidatus Geothermincolia bacterium]
MRIGITTTIPIELLYAAGCVPVDLNNRFMAHPNRAALVESAEAAGFPANFCAWIKGIYGFLISGAEPVEAVIAVMQGDCSNTQALAEALEADGMEVIPFLFPFDRDREQMELQLEKLRRRLGAEAAAVAEAFRELEEIRGVVRRIDEMTWREGGVSGWENHIYQVSCSDMEGDPQAFRSRAERFCAEAAARAGGGGEEIRLGYVGVPPIAPELYEHLESWGARVVYNEVQRQFTLPGDAPDLADRYLQYTYPYSVFGRIEDIEAEARRRGLDGLIHYVQSFCFRQVEDMLMRRRLELPILTLEMDQAVTLDARTRTRLETFVGLLRERAKEA